MAAVLGGAALGVFIDRKRNDYLAERDAVLRHYVELHPEDFPTPGKMPFFIIAPSFMLLHVLKQLLHTDANRSQSM